MMQRFSQVSTTRALLMCAVGALAGLGIAGYGLFTAPGTSTRSVPAEDVATVNHRPLLRSDFINQVEMETGKKFEDTQRRERLVVLDEMIREELLVQRGLELDFAETDQGTRNALVAATSDQVTAEVTTREPGEQELQDYYRRNPGKWATEGVMTLRHFVRAITPADRAGAQAPAALDSNTLAGLAQSGFEETQPQNDEYYFTVKYRLGDELFKAIQSLSDGEFSAPVVTADAVHVVEMIHNTKPVPLGYRMARSQVLTDYNEASRERVMASTLKFLRSKATVLIAPDYADYHEK